MKRIIICGGLAVAVLLMVASTARAEIAGIKDVSECPKIIKSEKILLDALNNLSPQSQFAAPYFQADKNRFVFCMDKTDGNEEVKIKTSTMLSNASQYSVIIYDLATDSSKKNIDGTYKISNGISLLTTTGPILLQNLTAPDLRGPIVMGDAASMQDATLSCDTTSAGFYPNKILMVTGTGETLSKVSVANCNEAIEVSGTGNILKDITVTFDKTKSASGMDGGKGIVLGSVNNLTATSLGGTTISGYASALEMFSSARATTVVANGPVTMKESAKLSGSTINGTIHVEGNNALITKSTLAGDPAVQIAKGLTGVTVSQNNYTNVNTIAYVDPDDAKAHTLLGVEWMGLHVPDGADYADQIVGKLLDQNSVSTSVEFYVGSPQDINMGSYLLNFTQTCPIKLAAEPILITMTDPYGSKSTKKIQASEKYFDCSTDSNSNALNIPLRKIVRFIASSPVSLMTDDSKLSDWPHFTVLIVPGQVVSGEGGGLVDSGGVASSEGQNDAGGGGAGTGSGSDATIPDNTTVIVDGESGSSGSAMSSGATVVSGDAGPSAAGPGAGCGGQMMPGIPAQPSVILWWLVPVAALWYRRHSL